jgi:hypothetical protein
MSKSVFCIANNRLIAERIIERLEDAGFPLSSISVLYPEPGGIRDIGHEKSSKAPEGAIAGAATGGIAGGVIGLLAGIGALAIPGLGAFIAAGPIMAALSGAAAGAAAGGVVGGLIGLGIPEIEAKHYETKLRLGNYFVSVHVENLEDCNRVKAIFKEAGAEDIGASREVAAPAGA